jgi:apoptosis-inducing factor 3
MWIAKLENCKSGHCNTARKRKSSTVSSRAELNFELWIGYAAEIRTKLDRPNLSKDYLAGTAQEDWIPLRPSDYYRDRRIELLLHSPVSSLDTKRRRIVLENGKALEFGALRLATGAGPVRLPIEGATDSQLHYLRTFGD